MVFRSNSAHFAYICSSAIGFRFFHDRKQNVVGTEIRSAFRAFSIQMLAISSERATDFIWPFISNNFYKKTWRFLLRTILIVIVCCENGRRRSTCVCVTHEQLDRHTKIFRRNRERGKKSRRLHPFSFGLGNRFHTWQRLFRPPSFFFFKISLFFSPFQILDTTD